VRTTKIWFGTGRKNLVVQKQKIARDRLGRKNCAQVTWLQVRLNWWGIQKKYFLSWNMRENVNCFLFLHIFTPEIWEKMSTLPIVYPVRQMMTR
jgi:hypothetical protein